MFLIVADSYSKWVEAFPVNLANPASKIEKLRYVFATHGLPKICVTDNASCFTSNEIRHITSAPYHPATNGPSESPEHFEGVIISQQR